MAFRHAKGIYNNKGPQENKDPAVEETLEIEVAPPLTEAQILKSTKAMEKLFADDKPAPPPPKKTRKKKKASPKRKPPKKPTAAK